MKLTAKQWLALQAAASSPLLRNRTGWSNEPSVDFPAGTVDALARLGLVKVNPMAGCCGMARITNAGREALKPSPLEGEGGAEGAG